MTETVPEKETVAKTLTKTVTKTEKENSITLEEAVFLCYADGMRIGTERRTTRKIDGEKLAVTDVSEMNLNRYGNTVTAKVTHTETLDSAGNLLQFATEMVMGGQPMRYEGAFSDGTARFTEIKAEKNTETHTESGKKRFQLRFPVTVSSQGARQTQTLEQILTADAEPRILGGYGLETALLLNPIRTGETRQFFRLNPTMLKWETVEIRCFPAETVALPDGNFPLYRLETSAKLLESDGSPAQSMEQTETLWCDGKGYVWKRFSPLMNLSSWRTTSAALAQYEKEGNYPPAPTVSGMPAKENTTSSGSNTTDPLYFAENLNVPIRVAERFSENSENESITAILPKLADATEVVYLVKSLGTEKNAQMPIRGSFEMSDFQRVEALDDFTLKITVRASGQEPFSSENTEKSATVLPDDTQSGPMIQADATEIVNLAQSVASSETDSAKIAIALESFVYGFIRNKNYARGFVTALEVAQNPSGDCTEHAVLLAALARARGIPARVAQGLIYETRTQKMAWHVWNELYVNGQWMPFDATLGRGTVGANHIRINAGSFSSATLAQTLLPAARLIGKIEVEVEEVREESR